MEIHCVFVLLLLNVLSIQAQRGIQAQRDYYTPDYYTPRPNRYYPRPWTQEEYEMYNKRLILEAPFMAIILADNSFQEYPFMTGVIISNQWVLTTAKVLKLQADKRLRVLTGVSNLSSFEDGNVNRVLYCKLHPQYNSDEIYNDIALIKLARPIVFNEKEGMLPLMSLNDLPYPPMNFIKRRNLTVFSYGSAIESSNGILKKNVIGINTGVVDLRERIFVAAQRTIPTCYGDSGSPAIIDGKLAGLLIIEDRCNYNFPNVFVSILHYYDWIKHVIHY